MVACDLPFLPAAFFATLVGVTEAGPWDAVVPLVGGRRQTTAAAYAKSALPRLEEALEAERPRTVDLLSRWRVRYLTEGDLAGCGDPVGIFRNVNTPGDLEEARKHLEGEE